MTSLERYARFDGIEDARQILFDVFFNSSRFITNDDCAEMYNMLSTRLEEKRNEILEME